MQTTCAHDDDKIGDKLLVPIYQRFELSRWVLLVKQINQLNKIKITLFIFGRYFSTGLLTESALVDAM